VQVLAATLAAAPDPSAKVPALPTACFASQDHWSDTINAAIDSVQQDHYRQNDVNSAIEQNFVQAQEANPMAMAQAMQQQMMSDPQNAQKYMQRMMQQGQQTQTEIPAQQAKEKQLDDESKAVMQRYRAALAQVMGPANARWAALKKKRGYGPEVNWPGETGEPGWVYAEWGEILRDRENAYLANCAQWWTASGSPIRAYLKRYKDYLVLERTPYYKRIVDESALEKYRLLKIPTAGYRTTTDYDAAELYMKRASAMFGERRAHPRCSAEGHCDALD
jgi:hypothetical protein